MLFAKEQALACPTQQPEMSQGMFRALSVIILLTYTVIASRPSCIIVDDIGEGLDFERSCKLSSRGTGGRPKALCRHPRLRGR